jgi:hypothetical protein
MLGKGSRGSIRGSVMVCDKGLEYSKIRRECEGERVVLLLL